MVNVFSSFWSWLIACLDWFFPPTLLQDPLISNVIIPLLLMVFGLWLFYIILIKPILMLMGVIGEKIYK